MQNHRYRIAQFFICCSWEHFQLKFNHKNASWIWFWATSLWGRRQQGRARFRRCCVVLSVPPSAVSSIQVAPSDISGVFWEWTKLVLDIGNFLANATIWLLTRKGWAASNILKTLFNGLFSGVLQPSVVSNTCNPHYITTNTNYL